MRHDTGAGVATGAPQRHGRAGAGVRPCRHFPCARRRLADIPGTLTFWRLAPLLLGAALAGESLAQSRVLATVRGVELGLAGGTSVYTGAGGDYQTDTVVQAPAGGGRVTLTVQARTFLYARELDRHFDMRLQADGADTDAYRVTLRETAPDLSARDIVTRHHTACEHSVNGGPFHSSPRSGTFSRFDRFDFRCVWPPDGETVELSPPNGVGDVYTYSLSEVPLGSPGYTFLFHRLENIDSRRYDLSSHIADFGTASVTIAPRHGSISNVRETVSMPRSRYFRDEPIVASLEVAFDYREEGPATKASTLAVDAQDVRIALVGSDGGTVRTQRFSDACEIPAAGAGDTDTESVTCDFATGIRLPSFAEAGRHTVAIPAGDAAVGSSRYVFRVNGVPHRASEEAAPHLPVGGGSVVVDIEDDVLPVFDDISPRSYEREVSVTIRPPAVSGGNGAVSLTFIDPEIPGMVLDPANGNIVGIPASGIYRYTVIAEDSDSEIDPGRENDVVEGVVTIRISHLARGAGSRVSLASDRASGVEGDTVEIAVRTDLAVRSSVTVAYSLGVDADPATPDAIASDYRDLSGGSVTLAPGDHRATIRISLLADSGDEPEEVFLLELGGLAAADAGEHVYLVAPTTSTIAIGEPAVLSLSGPSEVAEGTAAAYTLSVSEGVLHGDVTLGVGVVSDTASSGDYTLLSAHVTVTAGEPRRVFWVLVADDRDIDSGEDFTVRLGNVRGGGGIGAILASGFSAVDTAIRDDDSLVSFVPKVYEAFEEHGPATVTLSLPEPPSGDLGVEVTATPVGGAVSADFRLGSTTATFSAGSTVATVLVAAVDDRTDRDPGESVRLGLGALPSVLALGESSTVLVDLVDGHNTVRLAGPDAVGEGIGVAVFTLTVVERPSPQAITATLTVEQGDSTATGAADMSGDFVTPSPVVQVPPGESSATFTVRIVDDLEEEAPDESFRLRIREMRSDDLSIDRDATPLDVSIRDNDGPRVSYGVGGAVDATRVTLTEGEFFPVTVLLDKASTRDLTIPVVVNAVGDAASADYAGVPGSVVFLAGATSSVFRLSAVVDAQVEGADEFILGFPRRGGANPVGLPAGVGTGTLGSVHFLIRDREVSLSLPAGAVALDEGSPGVRLVTIAGEIGAPLASDLVVTLAAGDGGAAAQAVDYNARFPEMTILAGETSASVAATLTVLADDLVEDDETILVGGEADSHRVAGVPIPIADDDEWVAELGVEPEEEYDPVAEKASIYFNVYLYGNVGADLSVPWRISGEGTADQDDVRPASGTVTFSEAGFRTSPEKDEWTRRVHVRVVQDWHGEPEERLVFRLGRPSVSGDASLASRINVLEREATVRIAENGVVTVSLSRATEGVEGKAVHYSIRKSGLHRRPITVDVSVSPPKFTAPGSVTLRDSQSVTSFFVSIPEDDDDMDEEFFVDVSVRAPAEGEEPIPVLLLSPSQRVSVRDNDAVVTVSLVQDTGIAVEGSEHTVGVLLDRPWGGGGSIDITAVPLGGATFSDFVPSFLRARFDPGEAVQRITVIVGGDSVEESGEGIRLELRDLPEGVVTGSGPSSVTVMFADPEVKLFAAPVSMVEGFGDQTVSVRASLAGPVRDDDLEIELHIDAFASSTSHGDYLLTDGLTATITAGSERTTATFTIVDDAVVEPTERLVVGGSIPSGGGVTRATTTIYDGSDDSAELRIVPGPDVVEGGQARFDVHLGPVDDDVTVTWQVLTRVVGRAGSDDVSSTLGSVVLSASSRPVRPPAPILVGILDDTRTEAAEAVAISLLPPSSESGVESRIFRSVPTASVTIAASDPLVLSLSGPDAVFEGKHPSYLVEVVEGSTGNPITVDIAVTGADASDYVAPASPLVMRAPHGRFTVTLVNDPDSEGDETLTVSISNPDPGYGQALVLDGAGEVETTIVGNDLGVMFLSGEHIAVEGGAAVDVSVALDRIPGRTVTIPLSVEPQGAGGSVGRDLAGPVPSELVFEPGTSTVSFPVRAAADRFNDDGETFRLSLDVSGLRDAVAGPQATAVLSVTDTDEASPNSPPSFVPATSRNLAVPESAVPGTRVGTARLEATDPDDGDELTYSLSGAGAVLFGITPGGWLTLRTEAELDFEGSPLHVLTVGVSDGLDPTSTPDTAVDASVEVSVVVTDELEPPFASPPLLGAITGGAPGHDALVVTWAAPLNSGPAISGYEVQYREEAGGRSWAGVPHAGTGTRATVEGLDGGSRYRVRARARNEDGTGPWSYSDTVTGGTVADLDVDASGRVDHHDALLTFYTWRFGGFLRANPRLLDLVYGRIQRQSGSAIDPVRVLENAEAMDASPWFPALDIDASGATNHHDALLTFYTWRFGGFLRANPRLLDLVYGRIQRQSGSMIDPVQVLENSEGLPHQ